MTVATNQPLRDTAGCHGPHRSAQPIDWARIGAYIVLLVLGVVYLGPLLMLLNTSLLTPAEFNRSPMTLPSSFSLDNFFKAWDKANFAQYLVNSVLYVVISRPSSWSRARSWRSPSHDASSAAAG